MLNDSLVRRYDVTTTLVAPQDPARIHGRRSSKPKAVYGAIQRADEEFRTWVDDRLAESGYEGPIVPRTATVLVANPTIAESVKGIKPDDLRGGAAVLRAVRRGWKHLWKPLDRVSQPVQAAHYQEEAEPKPDEPIEVVTEDYVGRDRRFTSDRRQTQERIAIQHDRRRVDRRVLQPAAMIH